MLTERFIKFFRLTLACITSGLVLLVFAGYRSLKIQTVQLINLQIQYQELSQKLTHAIAEQAEKLKQLELAEKKSSYVLN